MEGVHTKVPRASSGSLDLSPRLTQREGVRDGLVLHRHASQKEVIGSAVSAREGSEESGDVSVKLLLSFIYNLDFPH